MKNLVGGLYVLGIVGIVGFWLKDLSLFIKLLSIFGIGSWIMAGIKISISKGDKDKRKRLSKKLFLFGIPHIVSLGIIWFILK